MDGLFLFYLYASGPQVEPQQSGQEGLMGGATTRRLGGSYGRGPQALMFLCQQPANVMPVLQSARCAHAHLAHAHQAHTHTPSTHTEHIFTTEKVY